VVGKSTKFSMMRFSLKVASNNINNIGKPLDKDYANQVADYNRKTLGLNIIPADTLSRGNYPPWKQFQHEPITDSQHEKWKDDGDYCNGLARMHGRVWHRPDLVADTYWFSFDADNQAAIEFLCKSFRAALDKDYTSKEDLAQDFLVEFHADAPDRMHLSGYTKKPCRQK
jgi:hypothetical protein